MTVCQFSSRAITEWYVVIGTARDLVLSPRSHSGGSLVVFRLSPDGSKLEHVHTVRYHLQVLRVLCTHCFHVDTTG